jgi:hypothetical protein
MCILAYSIFFQDLWGISKIFKFFAWMNISIILMHNVNELHFLIIVCICLYCFSHFSSLISISKYNGLNYGAWKVYDGDYGWKLQIMNFIETCFQNNLVSDFDIYKNDIHQTFAPTISNYRPNFKVLLFVKWNMY